MSRSHPRRPRTPSSSGLPGAFAALATLALALSAAGAPGPWARALAAQAPDPGSAPGPADAAPAPPGPRTLTATPAAQPISLDGRLDEEAWSRAEAATGFVQLEPVPGAPPSERTEARVLFDDEGLWIGIRAHDGAPDGIVGQLARRDSDFYSDWVWVGIDSYFDRRTAFVFGVNAAGVERDIRYANDDVPDDTWDAVWDAAVSTDRHGWTAELRIPYSQLRFSRPEAPGETVRWGLQFSREIARKRETVVWSPMEEESGAFVSRFGELRGLAVSDPPRRMEVMPYSVARLTRAPGSPANPFYSPSEWGADVGGDVKLGVGSGLTLTGTVNPDFGQVEADPSVVNLTAFETFFPEKRPFFVEGSEAFDFLGANLFYSRRIGRRPQAGAPPKAAYADAPEAATILGAAKLSGKTDGGWTLGVVEAVTSAERASWVDDSGVGHTSPVEPLTNYAAVRAQRDFRDGRTALGGIATATNRRLTAERLTFLHEAAYAGGLDVRHRFAESRYRLRGSVSGSHVRGSPGAIARTQRSPGHYFQRPDAGHLEFDPDRTSLTGGKASAEVEKIAGGHWRWSLSGQYTGADYEVNDLGFHFGNDRITQSGALRYVELAAPGPLERWSAGVSTFGLWTTGGERVDFNATADADVQLRNGWGGGIWGMLHWGGVDPNVLRGGPALHNPGRWMGRINVRSDRRKAVSAAAMLYLEGEDGTDGSVGVAHAGVTVRPSARARFSAGPMVRWNTNASQYVRAPSVGGAPHYVLARLEQRTVSMDVRGSFTFSPDLSLEVWLQPFVAAGGYDRFVRVERPRDPDFGRRFHRYGPAEISTETRDGRRVHTVTPAGAPAADAFTLAPDFNVKQLRSNAVLRWEYRPGSTLFLVWSQDRSGFEGHGRFRLGRDLDRLLEVPARNVFLVKLSYWMGG